VRVTATSTSQTRIPRCGDHNHLKSLIWGKSGIYETDFAAPFPAPRLRVQERIRCPTGDLANKTRVGGAEASTNGPVKSKAQLALLWTGARLVRARTFAVCVACGDDIAVGGARHEITVPVESRGAGGGRG